eukprot:TRINITY_DN8942_c0_g2_i1.p1 TRINITY_DN8942_c0_g2~~TRINITY_DN8942_c0_g2_i1.p1  ORF type:complete len:318 (+),score=22.19 TRINITY_DN8942_c0_g2_i1:53-1006(+)
MTSSKIVFQAKTGIGSSVGKQRLSSVTNTLPSLYCLKLQQYKTCRNKQRRKQRQKQIICQVAGDKEGMQSPHPVAMASYVDKEKKQAEVAVIKNRLFREITGLDRGLAAIGDQPQQIEQIVEELVAFSGKTQLNWTTGIQEYSTMDELQGVWRLAYTSAFTSGSLGGRQPGPPAAFIPLILGSIYQVINNAQGQLDNVVDFFFNYSLPFTPQFSSPVLRATLKHSFEVEGSNTVRIVFKNTEVKLIGQGEFFNQLPSFDLPEIPSFISQQIRSATFEVLYLDEDIRITRGDRGELRIYARCFEESLMMPLEMQGDSD